MLIAMSGHEINRFKVLKDVREKRLRQIDAADILNISTGHVRHLLNQLSIYGAQSLAHAVRGRPSNRRYDDCFRSEVLRILREQHFDFSPTFSLEKLSEDHNLTVSKETLRLSDKCCLLVFIDDATGRLMNLRFSKTESAFDYMLAAQNT